MNRLIKKIVGGIVILAILVGSIWFCVHKLTANKTKKPTTVTTQVVAINKTTMCTTTDEAYASNKETWLNHQEMEVAAQMALVTQQDRLIRDLIEKEFVKYDPVAVALAGNMIHRIGGEGAIRVIMEYANDERVVVRKNIEWWYGRYNPGALDDRIEKLEVMHDVESTSIPPSGKSEEAKDSPAPCQIKPSVSEHRRPVPTEKVVTGKPSEFIRNSLKKNATKVEVTPEAENQRQWNKDSISFLQERIRNFESAMRTAQFAMMTSTTKDPEIKAERREKVREMQSRINDARAEIARLESELK